MELWLLAGLIQLIQSTDALIANTLKQLKTILIGQKPRLLSVI